MRKFIFLIFAIFLISFVSGASSISTSGEMSFDQQASGIVSEIVCMEQPLVCSENKIIGQIKGEIMNSIAAKDPKLAEAIGIFGQVQSLGAEVLKEVRFDDEGEIETGSLQFGNTSGGVGKIVNKNLKEGDIVVSNVKLDKSKTDSTFSFNKEGGSLEIKGDKFENIKACENEGDKCFVNLNEEGEISKAEFETNENGGTYVLGGTEVVVPANSRVTYDKERGIDINVAEGSELKELPRKKDGFEGERKIVQIKGKDVKFPNGIILQEGSLNVGKNGELFLDGTSTPKINNIEILFPEKMMIYTSGEECLKSCMSFDFENKELVISGGEKFSSQFAFKKGNDFIKIEEGDDYFEIFPDKNSRIEINNRDDEGLIPKLKIEGKFKLNNGNLEIKKDNEDNTVRMNKQYISYTSSPVEIEFDLFTLSGNQAGEYVKFGENQKLVMDNGNKYFITSSTEDISQEIEDISQSIESSRLSYNYPTEESLEKVYGFQINFQGINEGKQGDILSNFRTQLNTMTPEMKNSVKNIYVLDDKTFEDVWFPVVPASESCAFAAIGGKTVVMREKCANGEILAHESAHLYQFGLKGESFPEEDKTKLTNLFEKYIQGGVKGEFLERQKALIGGAGYLYDYLGANSEFDSQWNMISNDPYGKDLETHLFSTNKWDDGTSIPKNGCVSAYGCNKQIEDIATFVEKTNTPSFFKNLIDPKSEKFNLAYSHKLFLLQKYGFITKAKYDAIFATIPPRPTNTIEGAKGISIDN